MTIIPFNPFFKYLSEKDFLKTCSLLKAKQERINKDQLLFLAGFPHDEFAFLLEGSAACEAYSKLEEKIILFPLFRGDLIGDPHVLSGRNWNLSFRALSDGWIIRMDAGPIKEPHSEFEWRLHSLLSKGLMANESKLYRKVLITSLPSLRQKIMEFLMMYQDIHATNESFGIPFSRQDMANYLNTDRSALSKELGKMKREGIIEFERNRFRILKPYE